MAERIRGRVAVVLNDRELVINRGSLHGVSTGMRFAVLNRKGADVIDPDTGESLGEIEVEKVIVQVVRVQENASVARTFRTFRTGGGLDFSIFAGSRTEHETLRTNERTYREEIDDQDSLVRIGDVAIQVIGEEFIDDSSS